MKTILVADIGGTSVKIGFVEDGVPQVHVHLFPSADLRNEKPVASLSHMIRAFIEEAGIRPEVIVATVPGFLDKSQMRVLFAANLPELNGCALADELGHALGIAVVLKRDAVLALMGEYAAGACEGELSVAGFFFGTGVGAAYLEDGQAFRGSGWALELGHMPYTGSRRWIADDRLECLEAYVSGKVLERIAQKHGVPIGEVFSAAKENLALNEDISDFVRNQAHAVGSAIAILSPATVLLGGGICEMFDYPREALQSAIERSFPFAQIGQRLDLRWAALGWQSVLHGALLLTAAKSA